jgi:hypothetical protein
MIYQVLEVEHPRVGAPGPVIVAIGLGFRSGAGSVHHLFVGVGTRQGFCFLVAVSVEHERALPPDSTLFSRTRAGGCGKSLWPLPARLHASSSAHR